MQFLVEVTGYLEGDTAEEVTELLESKLKEIGATEVDATVQEVPEDDEEEEEGEGAEA